MLRSNGRVSQERCRLGPRISDSGGIVRHSWLPLGSMRFIDEHLSEGSLK